MARIISLTNFRQLFQKIWSACTRKDIEKIALADPISRFLVDKRHFSSENRRVKPNAFLPDAILQTSVFLIRDLSEKDIWSLGDKALAEGSRVPRGRAHFIVSDVAATNLRLLVDSPPPRHAILVGWPNDKSARMALAQELANRSQLILR